MLLLQANLQFIQEWACPIWNHHYVQDISNLFPATGIWNSDSGESFSFHFKNQPRNGTKCKIGLRYGLFFWKLWFHNTSRNRPFFNWKKAFWVVGWNFWSDVKGTKPDGSLQMAQGRSSSEDSTAPPSSFNEACAGEFTGGHEYTFSITILQERMRYLSHFYMTWYQIKM